MTRISAPFIPVVATIIGAVMAIPDTFDSFVPTNPSDFIHAARLTAEYVPFTQLNQLFLEADKKYNASHAYVSELNIPVIVNHNIRTALYAYALLYSGFPSQSPAVEQISSKELVDRIYLAAMLHDLGLTTDEKARQHLTSTTSFEIFGGFLAYDHLKGANYPSVGGPIIGDVIQSINVHSLTIFTAGNSSAAGQLLHLSALFDVGGWEVLGPGVCDLLWHNQTIAEIERAYPRSNVAEVFSEGFKEVQSVPTSLINHDVPPVDPAAIAKVITLVRD